jgi:hypothetical protein
MTAEPQDPAVMEFGDDDPADDEPASRNVLRALLADPRLVLVCAGLAGLAAFGSMVGEWFTLQVVEGDPSSSQVIEWRMGVNGAGSLGSAYLVGVLLLAILVMLTVGGPSSTRRPARLAGFGAAGALLAVLLAFRLTTGDLQSPGMFIFPGQAHTFVFGRGLTLAYLVPILAGLAFLLAARVARHEPTADEQAEPITIVERPLVDWAWRRPRQPAGNRAQDLSEPPPLDLTVKPATPFANPDPSTER